MITTAHVLVGGSVGNQLGRARFALPLAFLSHYVLDSVPHWSNVAAIYPPAAGHYSAEVVGAVIDTALAIGLLLFAARGKALRSLILWSAAFAALPDVDNLPGIGAWMRAWPVTAPAVAFHHGIQTNIPAVDWPMGVVPLALVGAFAWWSFRRRSAGQIVRTSA